MRDSSILGRATARTGSKNELAHKSPACFNQSLGFLGGDGQSLGDALERHARDVQVDVAVEEFIVQEALGLFRIKTELAGDGVRSQPLVVEIEGLPRFLGGEIRQPLSKCAVMHREGLEDVVTNPDTGTVPSDVAPVLANGFVTIGRMVTRRFCIARANKRRFE